MMGAEIEPNEYEDSNVWDMDGLNVFNKGLFNDLIPRGLAHSSILVANLNDFQP